MATDDETASMTTDTSESEDDEARCLTKQKEKDWAEVMIALRNKNPQAYRQDVRFYQSSDEESDDSSDEQEGKETHKQKQPMYLKDYERNVMLDRGGKFSDSESDEEFEPKPTYSEELKQIKDSILKADNELDGSDDFLTTKKKTSQQQEDEDEDYDKWLKENPVAKIWDKSNLSEEDKFFKDYFLNKRYLVKEDVLKKKKQKTTDSDSEESDASSVSLLEDDDELERQNAFERQYNFRFEEPDRDFIKTYPREISDSLRAKKTKRAERRKRQKERKAEEKEQRHKDIAANVSTSRDLEKLNKYMKRTKFTEDMLDGDFDSEKHDRLMQQMYGNEDEFEDFEGDEPYFSDDEADMTFGPDEGAVGDDEELEDDDNVYDGQDYDEEFNMDADYDPSTSETRRPNESRKKKRRQRHKAKERAEKARRQQAEELLQEKRLPGGEHSRTGQPKPRYDPKVHGSFDDYFDKYHASDYVDTLHPKEDDVPFKYYSVKPNDYGLTAAEVLVCSAKELNQWAPYKKFRQYRSEEEQIEEINHYKWKAKDVRTKHKFLPSLARESEREEKKKSIKRQKEAETKGDDSSPKKKKKKANHDEPKPSSHTVWETSPSKKPVRGNDDLEADGSNTTKGKDKKKKKNNQYKKRANELSMMSSERLKALGINPKKFKYTLQQKQKAAST